MVIVQAMPPSIAQQSGPNLLEIGFTADQGDFLEFHFAELSRRPGLLSTEFDRSFSAAREPVTAAKVTFEWISQTQYKGFGFWSSVRPWRTKASGRSIIGSFIGAEFSSKCNVIPTGVTASPPHSPRDYPQNRP